MAAQMVCVCSFPMATALPPMPTFPTGNTCSLILTFIVFDFRNHGQNVPVVRPHHNYEQPAVVLVRRRRWT